MPEIPLPQDDRFPQVTSNKFPTKVAEILRSSGKNVSEMEKTFGEALAKGGPEKEAAIRTYYNSFDELLGTTQYRNALQSYEKMAEDRSTAPSRNPNTNTGLLAPPAKFAGVIGGEDIVETPQTAAPSAAQSPAQTPAASAQQPATDAPQTVTEDPATPASKGGFPFLSDAQENGEPGLLDIGLKAGYNAIVDKAKGVAQMIIGGRFFAEDADLDDEEVSTVIPGQEALTRQTILPTDSALKKRIKTDINKKLGEEKKFKKTSDAVGKWFDENLKADIPDDAEVAPIYYDKATGTLNTDNISNARSWVNTIASSAGGSVVEYATAVAAARASKGKSPATVKAIKNGARAFTFISSTAQMFPGYLQEGLDNGLSYSDALKVAGPLSVANGAIELVGLEYLMKGMKIGKPQATRMVRDVLDQSTKSVIKQLASKEITQEAFLEALEESTKGAFKKLLSKDGVSAAKVLTSQLGRKVKTAALIGALPESGEEVLQGGLEFGAKELYNKFVASKGSKPGEGKYDNNVGEAATNTFLGAIVGGVVGGGLAMNVASPKVFNQTAFTFANADIRNQLTSGATDVSQIKENGKLFQEIEKWRQEGQFDIPQNGTTTFDQQKYDQVVENANMMYDTAWEFRNFKDFDDLARYNMFTVASTRKDIRQEGAAIEEAKNQVAELDQMIADPASILPDPNGYVPSEQMLESQKADIVKQMGDLNPETGRYAIEDAYQMRASQIEGILKESVPAISDGVTRREGRSFMASGLNAVESAQYPDTDDFFAAREMRLSDGSVAVMNDPDYGDELYVRQLTAQEIPGSVLDQIESGKYKPVDRVKYTTGAITSFKAYNEALSTPSQALSKDTTRAYNVASDASEVATAAQSLYNQPLITEADAPVIMEEIDKIYNLYQDISNHPDAVDDGVLPLSKEEFYTLIGVPPATAAAAVGAEVAAAEVNTDATQTGQPSESTSSPSKSIRSLIDSPVTFNGQRSNLSLDGQTVIASPIGTNQEFEVGNIDEIGDLNPSELGIEPEQSVAQVNADGSITVRDKVYQNGYSNPLSAINRNKNGDITSVTLDEITPNGKTKKRTFRDQTAQDIAYEIILKENSKDDGTEEQFNNFADGNEFIQNEIVVSEASRATESPAVENTDAVSGSPDTTTGNSGSASTQPGTVTLQNIKDYAKRITDGSTLLKRLSPQIERGRAAGGIRNVEATIISARVSPTEGPNERFAQQEKELTEWAKSEGIWIENAENKLGELYTNGGESILFSTPDNKYINKITNISVTHDDITDFFDRISMHNILFPETGYELTGFTKYKGNFSAIVKQPLIQSAYSSDTDDIKNYLKKIGLKEMNPDSFGSFYNKDMIVSDLGNIGNVLSSKGKLFFVDPVIKVNNNLPGMGENMIINEITDQDILSNETTEQPSTEGNREPAPTLQSEYIAARELSKPLSDIEQSTGELRSTIDAAQQGAEIAPGAQQSGQGIARFIDQVNGVIEQAGRIDDAIEESTSQISDEDVQEPSDGNSGEEGTSEVEIEDVPLKVENTPISKIFTDVDRFQNRDTEFSESSVDSIVKAANDGSFDFTKFDPVRLWVDPKDGKTYVLAGHSRTEAFRRLNESGKTRFKNIPSVFMNHLSEAGAIKYALDESNTLATQETDMEGAASWRRMREAGQSDSAIRVSIGNRANKARIEMLSYLNPNGVTMTNLRAMTGASASNATRLNQVAEFIGNAYKYFGDQLTNSHEQEMYDYLTEGAGKKITKRSDFTDKLNNIVSNFAFDKNQPLNLANRAQKGNAQVEAENIYQDLLDQKKELEKERSAAKSEDNMNTLDAQIRNLNTKIVAANRAIADAKAGDRAQVSLFSFSQPTSQVGNNQIFDVLNQIGKAFPNITLNVPGSQQQYLNQLNSAPNAREVFLPGDEAPYGYFNPLDGSINLDPSRLNANTALHEMGHVWSLWAEKNSPERYQKGIDLIRAGQYYEKVKNDPRYANLTEKQRLNEALSEAIGDKGESFVLASRKKSFKDWLKGIFNDVKKFFGINNQTAEQVEDMDLETFLNGVVSDLMSGETISEISSQDVASILASAGVDSSRPIEDISEEQLQERMIEMSDILFSYKPPVAWGTRPGEKVGSAATYQAEAESLLSPELKRKQSSDFNTIDQQAIEQIRRQTGWEFTGQDPVTKTSTWENDISKVTNAELEVNEFLYTDDDQIVKITVNNPATATRGTIAKAALEGTKLMLDKNSVAGNMMNKATKYFRLFNIETVTGMMNDDHGLFTQLIKNVKRNGARRKNLAQYHTMDQIANYMEAMAPFSTYKGANPSQVRTMEVPVIMKEGDQVVKKIVHMPVGTAMNLVRTEMSQRSMGAPYLTRTDNNGIKETHSSLILDDRHFIGNRIATPNDLTLLYSDKGVHKGARLAYSELMEKNAAGELVPLKDELGQDSQSVSFLMQTSDMNRMIGRFTRGIGAQPGEVDAFQLGTDYYNNQKVKDLLKEENDKFLNPARPFGNVSFYVPLSSVSSVRGDAVTNTFSPNLEDSKRLHERESRPEALNIQDDVKTAQYYMESVSTVLGYGRLVHNLKNIRDALVKENATLPNNERFIKYLDAYISSVQNFNQVRATELNTSAFSKFINWWFNKYTKFIFRGGIGISLTQSATFSSALGQGYIQDKYLAKSLLKMAKYTAGAYTDTLLGAGSTVNQSTGQGETNKLGWRTLEGEAIDYITGKNISDPVRREAFVARNATIVNRLLNNNNPMYIKGVDFVENAASGSAKKLKPISGSLQQLSSQWNAWQEEHLMSPIRRSDRAVILAFIDAARLQASDLGLTGDAYDEHVSSAAESTMYATNQMNDITDITPLQRSTDSITRFVTVYSGQTQKLFNTMFQALVDYHKFGKDPSTPASVEKMLFGRVAGTIVSNAVVVPLWIATTRAVWGIVKSLLKGDELKDGEDYIDDIWFDYIRSIGSIVPGWTEQVASVLVSQIDNQKWSQSLFEITGIDLTEKSLKSFTTLTGQIFGKGSVNDKSLDAFTYNMTQLGAFLLDVPKVITDVLYSRFTDDDTKKAKPKRKIKKSTDPMSEDFQEEELQVPL